MDVALSTIGSLSLELNPPASFIVGVQGMVLSVETLSPANFEVNLMALPGPRGPTGAPGDLSVDDPNIVDPTAYYILAKS